MISSIYTLPATAWSGAANSGYPNQHDFHFDNFKNLRPGPRLVSDRGQQGGTP